MTQFKMIPDPNRALDLYERQVKAEELKNKIEMYRLLVDLDSGAADSLLIQMIRDVGLS